MLTQCMAQEPGVCRMPWQHPDRACHGDECMLTSLHETCFPHPCNNAIDRRKGVSLLTAWKVSSKSAACLSWPRSRDKLMVAAPTWAATMPRTAVKLSPAEVHTPVITLSVQVRRFVCMLFAGLRTGLAGLLVIHNPAKNVNTSVSTFVHMLRRGPVSDYPCPARQSSASTPAKHAACL